MAQCYLCKSTRLVTCGKGNHTGEGKRIKIGVKHGTVLPSLWSVLFWIPKRKRKKVCIVILDGG